GAPSSRSDHTPIAVATPMKRNRSTVPRYGGRREVGVRRRLRCAMGTAVVPQQMSSQDLSSSRAGKRSALTVVFVRGRKHDRAPFRADGKLFLTMKVSDRS